MARLEAIVRPKPRDIDTTIYTDAWGNRHIYGPRWLERLIEVTKKDIQRVLMAEVMRPNDIGYLTSLSRIARENQRRYSYDIAVEYLYGALDIDKARDYIFIMDDLGYETETVKIYL